MDKITHEMRLSNWTKLIRECNASGLAVIVNKKVPKIAEKIPHFIYPGKSTAMDAFSSFLLSFYTMGNTPCHNS